MPGVLGFLTGGIIFGLTYKQVFVPISKLANYGNITIGQMFNVNSWLVISLFVLASITLFYVLEKNNM
ncbi:MAG: hypothetical protein H0Z35_09945 [Thermoanaerobacteraceae bacterium]|nr:hypothetical protein [Thermoanaerobacteraceae bacterium]